MREPPEKPVAEVVQRLWMARPRPLPVLHQTVLEILFQAWVVLLLVLDYLLQFELEGQLRVQTAQELLKVEKVEEPLILLELGLVRPPLKVAMPLLLKLGPAEVQLEPAEIQLEPAEVQLEPAEVQLELAEVQLEPAEVQLEPAEVQLEPAGIQLEPAEVQLAEKAQLEKVLLVWEILLLSMLPHFGRVQLAQGFVRLLFQHQTLRHSEAQQGAVQARPVEQVPSVWERRPLLARLQLLLTGSARLVWVAQVQLLLESQLLLPWETQLGREHQRPGQLPLASLVQPVVAVQQVEQVQLVLEQGLKSHRARPDGPLQVWELLLAEERLAVWGLRPVFELPLLLAFHQDLWLQVGWKLQLVWWPLLLSVVLRLVQVAQRGMVVRLAEKHLSVLVVLLVLVVQLVWVHLV